MSQERTNRFEREGRVGQITGKPEVIAVLLNFLITSGLATTRELSATTRPEQRWHMKGKPGDLLELLSAIRSLPNKRVAAVQVVSVLDARKYVARYSFDLLVGRRRRPDHWC